ncbi:nitroreductase [Streptomyces sp. NPDC005794]|uniref:nitroreductase n=1 Tax=Streptomyces sp. NPDC005794 TaxID=3364733 RepID=UPI0036AE3784
MSTTAMPTPASVFTDIVQARHSVRSFLPDPLSASDMRGVLEDAQAAPSNCNTQPWTVHIVSGAARDALSKEILRADEEDRFSPDFTFDYADFGDGAYLDRAHHHAATVTQAQGLKREDREARKVVARKGLEFFGAPHAAFLFMPTFGDGVRAAGDIGMYGQNFLLSLAARGLAGIPQTQLGFHADTVRDFLGVPEDLKLLFGISFGIADETTPVNNVRMDRIPLQQSVVLHDTPSILDA